ncbi:MAG TPA: hypothetical protein PKH19_00110 [Candidatus Syntrophosphaera sp.]|nr:hypothetical protein [Candidatus Syntrophosphaera sp.]
MTAPFYFKVNLNKYGEMKLQAERENKSLRNAVIIFLLGAMLAFAGLFYLNGLMKTKVENRRKFYNEISSQLSKYQSSGEYLSANDVDKLAKTFANRIFWTKKLKALSDNIDQRLAVRKLNYSNGVLTLNGIIEVNRNIQEGDLTFEFVQKLKADPEISNDFPEIKSGSKTRQIAKDTEILEFVIECYSREALAGRRRIE